MVRRLKLFWKLALIAVLIPLSVVLVVLVALRGTWALQTDHDNLYGNMLLPIVALEEANSHREALSGELRLIARLSADAKEERTSRAERVKEHETALLAFVARYKKEWIIPERADFMETLSSMGEQKLGDDESSALELFDVAYASYEPLREHLLKGEEGVNERQLEGALTRLAEGLSWLQAL